MNRIIILIAITAVIFAYSFLRWDGPSGSSLDLNKIQQSGVASRQVTMIDLGAQKCIPCKMMAPIIEELKEEYEGKANIVFIDVWQKPDEAKKYGIMGIPTQIFFDRNGKEYHRHAGFLDKQSIIDILHKLGVNRI